MFVKVVLVGFCLVYAVDCASVPAKIPDYVPLCKRNDPNLSQCYVDSTNAVLKHLREGIPEMRLRKYEPVVLEKVSLDQSGSSLALNADLSNMRVYGLTDGRATFSHLDLDKIIFEMTMEVPRVYMTADYKATGKVLAFNFNSNGTLEGNITGITATGAWNADKVSKHGKTYLLNFKSKDLKLDIKDIKMNFDNIFPHKEINDRTNEAINENIDVLYEEIKPILFSTINTVLDDAINSVYKTFPLETLFPN